MASGSPRSCATSALQSATAAQNKAARCKISDELFIPGTVYYLKRHVDSTPEYFSLWKRHPDEHFQQIVLSNILLSDHKCDSHYYALRDVLKGLPISSCSNEGILP